MTDHDSNADGKHSDEPTREPTAMGRRPFLKTVAGSGLAAGLGSVAFSGSAAAGSVTADVHTLTRNDNWQTKSLDNSYSSPVVVAQPVSYRGGDPCHTRLRSVSGSSFDSHVEEWPCTSSTHVDESIGCLVLDSGTQTTSSGAALEVGTATVTNTMSWTSVSFSQSFATAPVVISQAQTYNGSDPISSRNYSVTSSGFETTIQEVDDSNHVDESVGYLAIEPGTGTLAGRTFEAGTASGADHNWMTISFSQSYTDPVFVANIQTINGYDTCALRYRNLSGSGVEVFVEEDTCEDAETTHDNTEIVGYLVIEGATNSVETDTRTFSFDDSWATQDRAWSFTDPVTLAKPISHNSADPAHTRLKNVSGGGFDAHVEEWDYLDGAHVAETVSSFSLSEGAQMTASGTPLEAGTIGASGVNAWSSVSFSQSFSTAPVVVSQVQTNNTVDAVITRNKNVSTGGFDVAMQEQDSFSSHGSETVGYLAAEPGTGTLDGAAFEAGTVTGVEETWTTISFQQTYNELEFVADVQTTNGADPCALRYRNLSYDSVEVFLEEDTSADPETNHTTETVGYVVREGNPATLGGGVGYSDMVPESDATYRVPTDFTFMEALNQASSSEVIYIVSDVDLTDEFNNNGILNIPKGVTIASDRGIDGSVGQRLYVTQHIDNPLFDANDDCRVTGVRLEGPATENIAHDYDKWDTGIRTYGSNVRIDNCEIYGWPKAGVKTVKSYSPDIHHCSIHHCQMDGVGYGVDIDYGHPSIRRCKLDYTRHPVTVIEGGGGWTLEDSWIGPHTPEHHTLDHHGADTDDTMTIRNVTIEVTETGYEYPNRDSYPATGMRVRHDGDSSTSDGIPKALNIENVWFYHPGDGNGNPPPAPGEWGDAAKVDIGDSSDTWNDLNVYWTNNHFGTDKPTDDIGHPR